LRYKVNQLSFFEIEKPKTNGITLRDKGIRKAAQHAEDLHEGWQTKALDWLYCYAYKRADNPFTGEMVREAARGIVPEPPSLRAWGSVLLSAARRGWIRQVGWAKVSNPKAHRTPAALWKSCL
jgi:hypothetical protein